MDDITILIADDEYSIRRGLSTAIDWKALGARVIGEAANGEEAFALLHQAQPDVVITDIRMPGCTGLDMIERARQENLDSYFIILSGYEDFEYARRAIRGRVSAYLLKPIVPADLMGEVEKARQQVLTRRSANLQQQKREFAAQKGSAMLREQFYHSLARGDYHSLSEIEGAMHAQGLPPLPMPCTAMAFRFTLPDQADPTDFARGDDRLFRTALCNILRELAEPAVLECFLNDGTGIGVLVPACPDPQALAQKCIQTLRGITKLELSAGIGPTACSLLAVEESCRRALEAVEYHMYERGGTVFDAAALQEMQRTPPGPPPDTADLAEAVAGGDRHQIALALTAFFQTLLYVPMPPPRYVRGMCAYAVYEVNKYLAALMQHPAAMPAAVPAAQWQQEIHGLPTLSDLKSYMEELFMALARRRQEQKREQLPAVIQQARQYVRQNIFTRLRVEAVASAVHMSEGHLTAQFKKYTGQTLRDYILDCKLLKAKELLSGEALTVYEIAEKLEYGDYRSFSRAFKRFTSLSPTEYRNGIRGPGKGG